MDVNDASETIKKAVFDRQKGKKYMDPELNMRFSSQRQGNPFDIPETPDDLEMMVGWAFDRLRVIITIENHVLKFDGPKQILNILQDAALIENVDVEFSWDDGQWFIEHFGGKEDVLGLPKVIKRFGMIYRRHASEYETGEREDINLLLE